MHKTETSWICQGWVLVIHFWNPMLTNIFYPCDR